MNRLVNNASWLIGCKIVQNVLSFIISMMSARYLGPSNYGLINYATSVIAFIIPFATLGLTNILVQEIISKPDEEGEILGTSLLTCVLTSLLGMGSAVLFTLVANPGEKETTMVVALYSTILVAQALEMIQYWFQAKLLSKYTAIVSLSSYVVVSAYKIYLLATEKNVYWFALSYAIDSLIIAVLLLGFYKKLGGQKLTASFKRIRAMFAKSRYYIISSLMVTLFTQMDKVMLKAMIDDAATGIYSAATVCAGLSSFVFAAIIDSFRPVIFENQKLSREAFERSVKKLYSIVIYLSLAQCVAIILLANIIIWVTYGNEYAEAATTLRIATWYTTFSYLGMVRNIWILAENKQKYLWIINLSGALTNALLNSLLIPSMGSNGAAIASLITQMFTNVIMGVLVRPIRQNNHLMLEALNPKLLLEMAGQIKGGIRK